MFVATWGYAATFTVTTTEDAGTNSLRQAILDANAHPGADTIKFAIIGAFEQTIAPLTPLPTITDPVTIDGYTQAGAAENADPDGNTAQIVIEVDGSQLAAGQHGLHITTTNCTVRGLAIGNCPGAGIRLDSDGNIVEGNFIGLNATGFFDAPNEVGVSVAAAGNTIGGTSPAARNAISGNDLGVWLGGAGATNNVVAGNFIGTDASGFFAVANTTAGIQIEDATDNELGGTVSDARNVISGNAVGVLLNGGGASNNVVRGNYIGADPRSQFRIANTVGVKLVGATANTVGGATSPARNVIAGNDGAGVELTGGATANRVAGNYLGVAQGLFGLSPMPNATGVVVANAVSNTIGGTTSGAANVIAGNDRHGVHLQAPATNNFVRGNFIGTDAAASPNLGNEGDGVLVSGTGNLIGGAEAGAGNLIAFNEGNGVTVANVQNAILANAITVNEGLGIDLDGDGVTTNDVGDVDGGGNNRQNFPVLTNASSCTGITIAGTLHSTSNTDFEVEFFRNDACDASGFGEGQTLIGWTNVITHADGNVTFSVTYTNDVATGEYITATATDAVSGNTSEFSACLEVDRVLCVNVERATDENCEAAVAPEELDAGTLDPCGGPVSLSASPAGPYPPGTNLVVVTAMADGYTNSCLAQVIVVDQTPPQINCPTELIRTAGPLVFDRVTTFSSPPTSDACGAVTVVCTPPSGATFPIGTNTVNCIATDTSGNTNACSFPLVVLPFGTVARDLAVVGMKMPKRITLRATAPALSRRVRVQIQNRGPQPETIPDLATLANLVSLEIESLDMCADITPVLLPPTAFPLIVKSKGKLSVNFNVTYACANDPARGAGHEDFRYTVTLDRTAIDGAADGHPDDDFGPRDLLPGGVDANPDGKIRDKGVGARKADRTLGGPVLTDVVVK